MLHLRLHGVRIHAWRHRCIAQHGLQLIRRHLGHGLRGFPQHVRVLSHLLRCIGPLLRACASGARRGRRGGGGLLPGRGDLVFLHRSLVDEFALIDALRLQIGAQPCELAADGAVAGRDLGGSPEVEHGVAKFALRLEGGASAEQRLVARRADLESLLAGLQCLVILLGLQVAQRGVVQQIHLHVAHIVAGVRLQVVQSLVVFGKGCWVILFLDLGIALILEHLGRIVHVLLLRIHLSRGLRHPLLHLVRRHILHLLEGLCGVNVAWHIAAAHVLHHALHHLRVHACRHL
mmetsp:Transcript_170233/g.545937  ORF Transcript_170233/g.545937 Transcript_170233/m.545937 type:complete len:290 (+) Transcript_170233:905-1774(+)